MGTNFVPSSVVSWNGNLRTTTYIASTQLTVALLASDTANPGTALLTVINPPPGGGQSQFSVEIAWPKGPPTIQAFSPPVAVAGKDGFTLRVTGTNFLPNAVVSWNGNPRATTCINPTELTTTILGQDLATPGTAQVTVTLPPPGYEVTSSFTVLPPEAPTIKAISPTNIHAGAEGFNLTLTGSNFVRSSTVQWNGSDRPTTYVSSTELSAFIPASDTVMQGTALVAASTPAPGGGVSAPIQFTVEYPLPTIKSLGPAIAVIGSGPLTLTVNGNNFATGATVNWNRIPRVTTFVSSTELSAEILPTDTAVTAATSVPVTVENPAPWAGISNPVSFTLANAAPTITSVTPGSAVAGVPVTVEVDGSGFVAGAVVRFGNKVLQPLAVTDTKVSFNVPGATVGSQPVTVLNPEPAVGPSNTLEFDGVPAGQAMHPSPVSLDSAGNVINSRGVISANGRYAAFSNQVRDICVDGPDGCVPLTVQYTEPPSIGLDRLFAAWVSDKPRYVLSKVIWGWNSKSIGVQITDTCDGVTSGCSPNTHYLDASSIYPERVFITENGRFIGYRTGVSWGGGDALTQRGPAYIYDTCIDAAPGCTPGFVLVSDTPFAAPAVTPDGRYAVYDQQSGTNIQVMLHDTCFGAAPGCVPSDTAISDPQQSCSHSTVSLDGEYAVYECTASTGSGPEVYLRAICASLSGCTSTATKITEQMSWPLVSAGARFFAFNAVRSPFGALSTGFVFDTCNGASAECVPQTKPVCLNEDGAVANKDCSIEGMTPDGKYIIFYSGAENLKEGIAGASYVVRNPFY